MYVEILNCTLSSEIYLVVVFVWFYSFSVLNKIKFGGLFFLNLFISPLKSGSFFSFFILKMFLAIVSVWFFIVGGDISCSANPVSCVSSQSKQWGNLAGCCQTRKRKQRRSESKVSEISSPVYYYSPLLLLLVFSFVRIGMVFMVFLLVRLSRCSKPLTLPAQFE